MSTKIRSAIRTVENRCEISTIIFGSCASYESMMAAIHLTWAVMLWRASANPAKHSLFIDFTIWANAAHGLVMLVATPLQKGLVMSAIEALPLLGIAAVLWWLRPRRSESSWGSRSYKSLHPTFRALDVRSDRTGPSASVRRWRSRYRRNEQEVT